MKQLRDEPFANHTTLRLGGPAHDWRVLESEAEIVSEVATADGAGVPFIVLGGGSNVVVADAPCAGRVLHIASRGISLADDTLTVEAGEPWDDVVAHAVAHGLQGIECLSGIPGTTGATPIQNVGAYGQEVADVITAVHAYDREERALVVLAPADCGFSYRDSVFKGSSRWVVTRVVMKLRKSAMSAPLSYAELTNALGAEVSSLSRVRDTVIVLRRGKGMVVDASDSESRSAGSFFTNPIVSDTELAEIASRLGVAPPAHRSNGRNKVPAAWLIERAGFSKGFMLGRVGISKKHSLALVNRGGTTEELVALARHVRDGVLARTGITLVPEPVFVGVTL